MAGIATFVVYAIVALILFGPGVALFFAGYATAGIAVSIIGGLLFLVLFVVISGALSTFAHAYWTLAYLRLVSPPKTAAVQEA